MDHAARAIELASTVAQLDKAAIRRVVDELIGLASADPAVAANLERLLSRLERPLRWPLAYVLGQLEPLSPAALKALLEALDHADPEIRWAIALLLARRARHHRLVRSALADLLRGGSETQRRMALYALRELDAPDSEWLGWFAHALADGDPQVRVAAMTSLKLRPVAAGSFADLLIESLLHDRDSRVRCAAATALGRVASRGERTSGALRQAASDSDPRVAKAARAAVAVLEKKGPA